MWNSLNELVPVTKDISGSCPNLNPKPFLYCQQVRGLVSDFQVGPYASQRPTVSPLDSSFVLGHGPVAGPSTSWSHRNFQCNIPVCLFRMTAHIYFG